MGGLGDRLGQVMIGLGVLLGVAVVGLLAIAAIVLFLNAIT
jgi:hypothetical protein